MKTPPLSLESLKALLQAQPHYVDPEGELNTALLHQLAQQCQRNLLELLFDNSATRQAFFFEHEGHSVFVRDHFIDYIQHKRFVANSYTAYRNKIGLHDGQDYLKKNKDIVLAFPFKDCVLEGGQSKSEAKRSERYYHRILAIEELDRLLEPKVLCNARRYTKEGPSECRDFTRNNSNNTISDNLIIKGNNLIALHSINEQFAKKVKLIYIDPPYNTGNDSFLYNDNFNHSTWLVFIKNRLEIARKLLRGDGVIFVQCDDNEMAYLKVLMDEVFGRENFVSTITTRATPNARDYGLIAQMHEFILFYANDVVRANTNLIDMEDNHQKGFCYTDQKGEFNIHPLYNSNVNFHIDNRPNLFYPFYLNTHKTDQNGFFEISLEKQSGCIEIYPPKSQKDSVQLVWRWGKEKSLANINKEIVGYQTRQGLFRIVQKMRGDKQLARTIWFDTSISNRRATEDLQKLFAEKVFAYPKPEGLLQRIIEIATKEGDLVLDFCLGSGTTAAVAHKMGRQYIGIEQMDYIQTIAVERLAKVIAGEQGGISKNVGWAGGGSFVYLELKAHNQAFIQRITEASSQAQLSEIQQELLQNLDLDYRLNTEAVQQSAEDFAALSLEKQRQILIDFLELNQLYVPYSERKDTRFSCTQQEIPLSESFYNGGNHE